MENAKKNISIFNLFISSVYLMEKPEFLDVAKKVTKKYLDQRKDIEELNPNFPSYMTENIFSDVDMLDISKFISQAAWEILDNQGYDMKNIQTYFTEMWVQEHHKGSVMDRHIHGNGSIISGFYFLECPENSKVIFHDLRDAKVITSLPEKDVSSPTSASNMIHFDVKDGMLMFTNSWLPHSFSKNIEEKPFTFIHFNIAAAPIQISNTVCRPNVEIV